MVQRQMSDLQAWIYIQQPSHQKVSGFVKHSVLAMMSWRGCGMSSGASRVKFVSAAVDILLVFV